MLCRHFFVGSRNTGFHYLSNTVCFPVFVVAIIILKLTNANVLVVMVYCNKNTFLLHRSGLTITSKWLSVNADAGNCRVQKTIEKIIRFTACW